MSKWKFSRGNFHDDNVYIRQSITTVSTSYPRPSYQTPPAGNLLTKIMYKSVLIALLVAAAAVGIQAFAHGGYGGGFGGIGLGGLGGWGGFGGYGLGGGFGSWGGFGGYGLGGGFGGWGGYGKGKAVVIPVPVKTIGYGGYGYGGGIGGGYGYGY